MLDKTNTNENLNTFLKTLLRLYHLNLDKELYLSVECFTKERM